MITQEQLAADQAAIDAAQAQLAKDTEAFNAVQPHLTLWEEVEAAASKYGAEAHAEIAAIAEKGKALLASAF